MSKYNYDGSSQFKPISSWGYVGYTLLFSIPLVGLVLLFVFAFSDRNINRRNYARSFFCWFLIGIIISVVIATGVLSGIMNGSIEDYFSKFQSTVQRYWNKTLNRTAQPTISISKTVASSKVNQPKKTETAAPENAISNETTDDYVKVTVDNKTLEVRQSFKTAMDEYEAFFDEYVEVLMSQDILKLSSFAAEYAETMDALDKIENDNLSDAELAYYTEVYARIMKKLSTVE